MTCFSYGGGKTVSFSGTGRGHINFDALEPLLKEKMVTLFKSTFSRTKLFNLSSEGGGRGEYIHLFFNKVHILNQEFSGVSKGMV